MYLVELGNFALALAFVVTITQVLYSARGLVDDSYHNAFNSQLARNCNKITAVLLMFALGVLIISYLKSDFSVLNVYQNSHSDKSVFYKISGVWSNHEGSILLWVVLFGALNLIFDLTSNKMEESFVINTLTIQGMCLLFLLGFVIFTSNPFERTLNVMDQIPMNGKGMNPLLEDFALAIHPPLLYIGYVGTSILFSMSIVALISAKPIWFG